MPDITGEGRIGRWTEAEFMRTLRTGIRPDSHRLDSTRMPWTRTRDFSDTKLRAVRAYLLSQPKTLALAVHGE